MITKAISPTKTAPSIARTPPWSTPAWTMEERLQRIEALGQRIDGYIKFMCQVASLTGASAEAKEKAVEVFYEKMLVVERQLGGVQEHLKLE